MKLKGKGKDYPIARLNAQRAYKKAERRTWINQLKLLRSQGHIP